MALREKTPPRRHFLFEYVHAHDRWGWVTQGYEINSKRWAVWAWYTDQLAPPPMETMRGLHDTFADAAEHLVLLRLTNGFNEDGTRADNSR